MQGLISTTDPKGIAALGNSYAILAGFLNYFWDVHELDDPWYAIERFEKNLEWIRAQIQDVSVHEQDRQTAENHIQFCLELYERLGGNFTPIRISRPMSRDEQETRTQINLLSRSLGRKR